MDTVAKFSYYDPAIWYDMTASRNYAVAPIDFMYGDATGKDAAWFEKQLSKISPIFFSGKRPFIAYTKTNFNAKVFGPSDKFPKSLGKYDVHFGLTSLDTALGRDRESVTGKVIEDMMGRGTTSEAVDYGTSLRRLGDCK